MSVVVEYPGGGSEGPFQYITLGRNGFVAFRSKESPLTYLSMGKVVAFDPKKHIRTPIRVEVELTLEEFLARANASTLAPALSPSIRAEVKFNDKCREILRGLS